MYETMDIAGFEQRVRDRAYAIWESEGHPFGRDVEHWLLSEEVVQAELAVAAPVEAVAAPEAALVAEPEAALIAVFEEPAATPNKPVAKAKASKKKPAVNAKRGPSMQGISASL